MSEKASLRKKIPKLKLPPKKHEIQTSSVLWAEGWSVQNKYTNVQRTERGRYDRVLRLGQLTPHQYKHKEKQLRWHLHQSLQRSLERAQRPATELAKHTEEIGAAWKRKSAVEKGRVGWEGGMYKVHYTQKKCQG